MEELQPEELEELLQELEEEYGAEESPSPEVEALLRDLQPSRGFMLRLRAARQLGGLSSSNRQIVQALGTVAEIDHSDEVRAAAAESLRAPVHQSLLQEHPELREAVDTALGKVPETARAAAPASPWARFQVENQGDTLCISWTPDMEERKDAAKAPLLVLLLSAIFLLMVGSMSPGSSRAILLAVLSVAAVGAGYWIAAIWVNATRISAGQEEWLFQRGPLPILKRQFYFRPRRFDPASCRWLWIDREERYKLKTSRSSWGSGGSGEGALGCLVALIEIGVLLMSIRRELVVTYKLYARCVDDSDLELLSLSSKREAEYLEQTLQGQLDARDGQPAQG